MKVMTEFVELIAVFITLFLVIIGGGMGFFVWLGNMLQ